MKFKIKDEEVELEKEPEIKLWLENHSDYITLNGEDNKGIHKILMDFKNGKFQKASWADLNGLDTDKDGKIIEEK